MSWYRAITPAPTLPFIRNAFSSNGAFNFPNSATLIYFNRRRTNCGRICTSPQYPEAVVGDAKDAARDAIDIHSR